jgi:hypothetical protein
MTTLGELIEDLRARGVEFSVSAGRVHVRGWRKLTADERDELRAKKALAARLLSKPLGNTPGRTNQTKAEPEEQEEQRPRVVVGQRRGPNGWELLYADQCDTAWATNQAQALRERRVIVWR